MKILFISTGDNGGGSWFCAEAINKYTEHEARSIRVMQSFINYPFDVLDPTEKEVIHFANWADVIHIRDGAPRCLNKINEKRKILAITFTGMSYRKKAKYLVEYYRRMGHIVCVSTADLLAYYPKNSPIWIPNPREEVVAVEKHSEFTVAHAPTYRDRKGTGTVIDACKEANIKLDLIENVSYLECLQRKAQCHLLVDQFSFGYGNNAIEAWSMHMPSIGATEHNRFSEVHKKFCNGGLPYVWCNEDVNELANTITNLRNDSTLYKNLSDVGYQYYLRTHHPSIVANKLIDTYKGVMK